MQSLTHPGSLATVLPAMAHIHEKIDFTVAIFVVHDGKVLLIHHRRLDKWLPLGGHIELDEDPEIAALREAKEESGLEVELIGERPPTTEPGTRAERSATMTFSRAGLSGCAPSLPALHSAGAPAPNDLYEHRDRQPGARTAPPSSGVRRR